MARGKLQLPTIPVADLVETAAELQYAAAEQQVQQRAATGAYSEEQLAAYQAATEQTLLNTVAQAQTYWGFLREGLTAIRGEAFDSFLDLMLPSVFNMGMQIAGITSSYLARRVDAAPVSVSPAQIFARSIPLKRVYSRPLVAARTALKHGKSMPDAMQIGQNRLNALIRTDAQLAKTRQAQRSLSAMGVDRYRRVIRSAKPCPLCLLASTKVYHTKNLMPIHVNCNCDVDVIPLNWTSEDLRDIEIPEDYLTEGPRGGNADTAFYLNRMRDAQLNGRGWRSFDTAYANLVEVQEHGEIGPVLTWKGQHFQGPPTGLETYTGVRVGAKGLEQQVFPVQTIDELKEQWYKLHPDIKLTGFDRANFEFDNPVDERMTVLNVRDFLTGVHRTMERYPDLEDFGELPEIKWGGMYFPNSSAETWPKSNMSGRTIGTSRITISPDILGSPEYTRQLGGEWEKSHPRLPHAGREYSVAAPDTAFMETTAIHELGHVVSNAGGKAAEDRVESVLKDVYRQENPAMSYDRWYRSQVTEYGRTNHAETLAEAFADVELNGEFATPANKALHKMLLEEANLTPAPTVKVDTPTPYIQGQPSPAERVAAQRVSPPVKRVAAQQVPADALQTATRTVEWTGPPVSPPGDKMWNTSNALWKSGAFDDYKDEFRRGGRSVQSQGYDAEKSALSLREKVGADIVSRAVHSEPTERELFRGMRVTAEDIANIQAGGELSMPLSSFVADADEARIRAGAALSAEEQWSLAWQSQEAVGKTESLVLVLEPGARAAVINDRERSATGHFVAPLRRGDEAVAFGRFEVLGVERESLTDERGGRHDLTRVRVRQTSMIERAVADPGRDALELSIPDIEVHADPLINTEGIVPPSTRTKPVVLKGAPSRAYDPVGPVPADAPELESANNFRELTKIWQQRHPTVELRNLGTVGQNFDTTKEFMRGVDDVLTDNPDLVLDYIGAAHLREGRIAETRPFNPKDGRYIAGSSSVIFDSGYLQDRAQLLQDVDIASNLGTVPTLMDQNTAYRVTLHEMGHVIDQNTTRPDSTRASALSDQVARKLYDRLHPDGTDDGYREWLHQYLDENAIQNWREAVADAYMETRLLGDKASPLDRELSRLITEDFKRVKPELPTAATVSARGARAQPLDTPTVPSVPEPVAVTIQRNRVDEFDRRAYEVAKANGGITIDLDGVEPNKGYAYAPNNTAETIIPLAEFTPEHVDDFIDRNFDELLKEGNHLGIWTEGDKVYIDISRVGDPTSKTIAAAQKSKQLAVFDLESFETIDIGRISNGKYTRTGKAADLHNRHRREVERRAESPSAPSTSALPGGPTPVSQAVADATADPGYEDVLKRVPTGTKVEPIYKRRKDGSIIEDPIYREVRRGRKMEKTDEIIGHKPRIDVPATLAAVPDEVLKDNWRKAIDQALNTEGGWAYRAGKVWYPELGQVAERWATKYAEPFRKQFGRNPTREDIAVIFAAYSENNSWAGNLLGVRQFLEGTSTSFHRKKARAAVEYADGALKWLEQHASPKIYNFGSNIAGRYGQATVDRWVSRIMLHTDDYEFADNVWGAIKTTNGVKSRPGYERFDRILKELQAEYPNLDVAALQAIPWVHVVGPRGAATFTEVVETVTPGEGSHTAINKALREETERRFGRAAVPDSRRITLPEMPIDRSHIRLQRDLKALIKEVEGAGLTEDNSTVRRVLNSATPGTDHLFAMRDKDGTPVAVALVDVTTSGRGRYRSTEYGVHELFKDDGAPPKSGTKLMMEVAQAAKADNAELVVRNALPTARTFYEQLGGEFAGVQQPGGLYTSQSSNARWTDEARDALAEGKPIPARHTLVEGPGEVDENGVWRHNWVEPPRPGPDALSINDPLMDLLDEPNTKSDNTIDEIMTLLGENNTPPPPVPELPEQPVEPPIPGVRRGEERWYKHLLETEDRTDKAHLSLPTELVDYYKEYDRPPELTDTLKKAVQEQGGIRTPLWISTDGKTALLVEGNHRLAVAKDLGIEDLPVRITFDPEVRKNEGTPVPLDPVLQKWIRDHPEIRSR